MSFSMFFWRNQNKIFQLIVLGVAIFMVHMHALWCSSKNSMLVLPFVWLGNFYSYIHTTIACFMKTLTSNRKLDANLIYHPSFGCLDFISHCFICAGWATRRIVIGIAVNTFFADNRGIAKWAWFGKKSCHANSVYQA